MTAARLGAVLGAALCLAAAAEPADRLADPGQETRARALFRETRCLVCQGESIDDSEADLARDLRQAVRAQVATGRNDAQVRTYLAARYGEFVLFRPPLTFSNAALWAIPFGVAALGMGILVLRGRRRGDSPTLSDAEEARIAALAGDESL
ncbi:MAG: cytochrome c-type biogenesis protein CcmH [Caulobacteraceae bacterium]|nr:cytochrome c-type biogenesis protein CcmH [Caulobacteraceae bacterium]